MKSSTVAVHWHDENQSIYSADFQPKKGKNMDRLVTGGGDNNIRVWKLHYNENTGEYSVEYLSTMKKHTQAVNVVRFDPSGQVIASAGDDGTLMLWKLSENVIKREFGEEADEDIQESWIVKKLYRTSISEIYDLAWSPDSKFIATGSMDNITRIYNVSTGEQIYQMNDHSHYVQGVTWDPKDEYLATQSADRSVIFYRLKRKDNDGLEVSLLTKSSRIDLSVIESHESTRGHLEREGNMSESSGKIGESKPDNQEIKKGASIEVPKKTMPLYYPETLQSFFRRLTFSPDGSLVLTPLGICRDDWLESTARMESCENTVNTVFVYTRSGLDKLPVCHIPSIKRPTIAIAFSPILYEPSTEVQAFSLPYKMIFAIATQDSVMIYDTCSLSPLAYVSNLHYSSITDIRWDADGLRIIVTSTDGFCSAITFDDGSFGNIYKDSSFFMAHASASAELDKERRNFIDNGQSLKNKNFADEEFTENREKESFSKSEVHEKSEHPVNHSSKKRRVVPMPVQ